MNFGTTLDRDGAFRVLDRFTDQGGTDVDTANCYASWIGTGDESELVLGAWQRVRRARGRIRLASKVGARPASPGDDACEGLSASNVRSATEESLRRLQTDHLDVCFAHLMDELVPLEETLGAFDELVTEGKVLRVGLSNQSLVSLRRARSITEAAGSTPVTLLQQRHSYLQPMPGTSFGPQIALSPEMADYLTTVPELTVQGYSPLLSGAYTRTDREFWPHYRHPGNEPRLAALGEVSRDLGVSENQVVLAWMQASAPAVQPVIGVSTVAQLDECLDASRLVLSVEELRRLGLNG